MYSWEWTFPGSASHDYNTALCISSHDFESVCICSLSNGMNIQVAPLDTIADCVTLLRHLVSLNVEPPLWRRSRPHLLIEGAVFSKATPEATSGTLLLDTYVRHVGISANQIIAVPGAGDFSIDKIWAAPESVPPKEMQQAGMAMLDEQQDLELLAQADEDKCVSVSLFAQKVLFFPCQMGYSS